MYSIYHLFRSLNKKKSSFKKVKKLDQFPFDNNLYSCWNKGVFPDFAIKINEDRSIFTGGELIELKDSKTYSVSSFNSTIPSGKKEISSIISSKNSNIYKQMEDAGNNIESLPVRDVYYLIRGQKKDHTKVCLVHGSFFETISKEDLISESFMQVFQEITDEHDQEMNQELKSYIKDAFSEQKNFSRVRSIDKASVKLRFRIMTEVKSEGNILNTSKYPEILDNTLNFVVPCDNKKEEEDILRKFRFCFSDKELEDFSIFKIKHHFNGYFIVFQTEF